MNPTLSGAERGKARPAAEVPGGIWIEETGELVNKAAWLAVVGERKASACVDYARQYLKSRGDSDYLPGQLARSSNFFMMHHALIAPPANGSAFGAGEKFAPLYPLPPTLTDEKGKLNPTLVSGLVLGDLASGQLDNLKSQYDLLLATQTPASISHAKWEAIVEEGKTCALSTLHSRHGSSALIQVLHGLSGGVWPE